MSREKKRIVYSCSGCSSAAQMANWAAVQMDRRGIAEMSCITGVGGGVKPLIQKARLADIIIGLDGCALRCVQHCLKQAGLRSTVSYDLSQFGVPKKYHQDFDPKEAERALEKIRQDLELKGIV